MLGEMQPARRLLGPFLDGLYFLADTPVNLTDPRIELNNRVPRKRVKSQLGRWRDWLRNPHERELNVYILLLNYLLLCVYMLHVLSTHLL